MAGDYWANSETRQMWFYSSRGSVLTSTGAGQSVATYAESASAWCHGGYFPGFAEQTASRRRSTHRLQCPASSHPVGLASQRAVGQIGGVIVNGVTVADDLMG